MRIKRLISAILTLAVACGIGMTVPIAASADATQNELIEHYIGNGKDYSAVTAAGASTEFKTDVDGLSGYGRWSTQKKSGSYTYTDANKQTHDYNFTSAWQAQSAKLTAGSFYFTPKSTGKVTVIFDGNGKDGVSLIVTNGSNSTTASSEAANLTAATLEISDTANIVSIYGGDTNKRNVYAIIIEYYELAETEKNTLPAFPGAEGGGKYTTGARGSEKMEVYHVTNLNSQGPGSLRDAIAKSGRIVVFDVSGVIELNSQLVFKYPNVTVLGQTAPGDGITIANYDVLLQDGLNNVIIRHLRVRPTDTRGGEPDGMGGRWIHNIVLDHCSLSWSVDELLTVYAGSLESNTNPSSNISVQYCLASESMRMSNHIKGAHGYGGIIGGTDATYHHNLFAHHDSRSPRFDRNLKNTDFVNNVIYDWGNTNSMYGAEPYSYSYNKGVTEFSTPEYASNVNIRNNYMKYGPSTRPAYRSRIFDVTNEYDVSTMKSNFFINGNYVYGNSDATENNATSSYINNFTKATILTEPVDMNGYDIEMQTAEETYSNVLDNVGATLPRRDEIDARIIADVKNGTGRIINTDEEVGSYLGMLSSESRVFEIPQEWKTAHNMGSAAETDIAPSGYTWIEEYVNDWTAEQETTAPTNPEIKVNSPAVATTDVTYDKISNGGVWYAGDSSKRVHYDADATPYAGTTITKMELWDGTTLLKTYENTSYIDDYIALEPGTHHLMCKAFNNLGERTQSPVSNVYITGKSVDGMEIGTPPYAGKSSIWKTGDKTYIAGSGLINKKSDSFAYDAYHAAGDFSFSCKIEDIPKYENSVQAGIMFRESLAPNSRMIMVSDLWRKYGENIQVIQRTTAGADASLVWLKNSSNTDIANSSSYDSSVSSLPQYMKIERSGDELTVSVSDSGTDWTDNVRQPMTFKLTGWSADGYVGLAVDSVNGDAKDTTHPLLSWFTIAAFSDIKTSGLDTKAEPTAAPTAEPAPTANPDATVRPEITPIPTGTPKPTASPTTSPEATAMPDNTPCVKVTAEYNADGSLKSVGIVNTTVKEAGTPVLTGLSRVYIWKAITGEHAMEPVEVE